ncbi:MAG: hypothetical protein M1355_02995 [Patescibacteria group bacterium]|nr:hypothetical protein [Patescibacteria group bacterium]
MKIKEKIYSFFVLIFVIGLFAPSLSFGAGYDASKANLEYKSLTKIYDSGNRVDFNLAERDPFDDNDSGFQREEVFNAQSNTFIHVFNQGSGEGFAIVVNKSKPKEGEIWEHKIISTTLAKGWAFVESKSIGGNAPAASKLITEGQITGRIQWDDPNNFIKQGAYAPYGVLGNEMVRIAPESGSYDKYIDSLKIEGFKGGNTPASQETDTYYDYIDLKNLPDGGLYPGDYKIIYDWTNNQVDCSSGSYNDSGIPFVTRVCTLYVKGEVKFHLAEDGKVTINSTDKFEQDSPVNNKNISTITSKDNGINLKIHLTTMSPLNQAILTSVGWMVDGINKTVKYLSGWIEAVLEKATVDDMEITWLAIRNITLTLLALGILIIAFANVLSLDIEKYGIGRMIPRLVLNVILIYFSFFMVKFLLDVANVLQIQFKALINGSTIVHPLKLDLGAVEPSTVMGNLGTLLFLIVLFIGVIIALVYLTLVLLARLVALKFLVVAAPIAFILGIMPFTEFLEKRWWSEMFKWIFMGPAIVGLLLVAAIITADVPTVISLSTQSVGEGLNFLNGVIGVAVVAVVYYLAAQIPTMMGGDMMKTWSDKAVKPFMKWAGKTISSPVAERTWLPAAKFFKDKKASQDERVAARAQKFRTKVAQAGGVGRWIAGTDKGQADTLNKAMLNDMEKGYSELLSDEEFANAVKAAGNNEKKLQALLRVMTKEGNTVRALEKVYGSEVRGKEEAQKLIDKYSRIDKKIIEGALDKHTDLALLSSNPGLSKAAEGKLAKQELKGLSGGEIKALNQRNLLNEQYINDAKIKRLYEQGSPDAIKAVDELVAANANALLTTYVTRYRTGAEAVPVGVRPEEGGGQGQQPPPDDIVHPGGEGI